MRRVILILLMLIQILFFINYTINDGIIFYNIYIWFTIAALAIIVGVRAFRSEPHLNESRHMHSYFSLALIIVSCASVLFILYIAIMQPYYL
ncbi:hypothetical protein JEOAER750_00354 [Jeotgalicoccus aerolatus]|uniref:Magnesium-transporting ATPase (P-type) n=1 Tax=Jeotgalicoccus aerolatus TaxID=709510 RepID=A0A1G8X789_9STAP|nr:hypothetical protein [Jeotgalicoccus aerolatus]MBP1952408.1 magnesium-transporting ATPase (P-type) [Jeotgalicoccus aerolatus]NMA81779.1 hypothetical protein [Jeotgalicoccus aerolatus]CAD2072643.1 hypothetical protein JEOAER750_00354 [Jeotgalicoccus aerolatus]SDJ85715.1 hypothetical protein SAMN05216187_10365 [Jeotgalicoccus aerolatus]GGE04024.1 hypothetical protein GCM10007273_15770 [Jeotgalicoccus aerolatus]